VQGNSDIFTKLCDVDAFGSEEFLKVWKGLHYCMWMTDKPLIQVLSMML